MLWAIWLVASIRGRSGLKACSVMASQRHRWQIRADLEAEACRNKASEAGSTLATITKAILVDLVATHSHRKTSKAA